jgi:hypothetical protein
MYKNILTVTVRILTWPVVLAAGVLLGVESADALTLSPPSMEFNLAPGQTISQKVRLYNDESKALTVVSSVANFTAQGETGEPTFDLKAAPTDLAAWINVPSDQIIISPNDKIDVNVVITAPANAEPGGHYASVFFGPSPVSESDDKQVNIKSLLGTLIIVRVSGNVREAATVAQFSAGDNKSFYSRLPIDFFLRLRNTGNVHVRPEGTIKIKSLFGTTTTLVVNDTKGAVLPETIRRFDALWSKNDTVGNTGNFFQEIGQEWKNFGFGSYTVTANLTYGQESQRLSASLKIFILPWRLLLVGLVALAGLIWLLIIGIKRYNRAIITSAQNGSGQPRVR